MTSNFDRRVGPPREEADFFTTFHRLFESKDQIMDICLYLRQRRLQQWDDSQAAPLLRFLAEVKELARPQNKRALLEKFPQASLLESTRRLDDLKDNAAVALRNLELILKQDPYGRTGYAKLRNKALASVEKIFIIMNKLHTLLSTGAA